MILSRVKTFLLVLHYFQNSHLVDNVIQTKCTTLCKFIFFSLKIIYFSLIIKIGKKHIVGYKKQKHESLKAILNYWTQKSAQPNYGKSTVCWKIDSQHWRVFISFFTPWLTDWSVAKKYLSLRTTPEHCLPRLWHNRWPTCASSTIWPNLSKINNNELKSLTNMISASRLSFGFGPIGFVMS